MLWGLINNQITLLLYKFCQTNSVISSHSSKGNIVMDRLINNITSIVHRFSTVRSWELFNPFSFLNCKPLHGTASLCTALQAFARHCKPLHGTASLYTALQAFTRHCEPLHGTASLCTALQAFARHKCFSIALLNWLRV